MPPISRRMLLLAWLLALALGPRGANPEPSSPPAPGLLALRYDRGRIEVRAQEVPLGTVLRELARQSAGRVSFTDPAIAHWSVSVAVEGLPLVEGLKEILDGLSYAIYRSADTWRVMVLSSPPDPASTGSQAAGTERPRLGAEGPPVLEAFPPPAREDEALRALAEGVQQEDSSTHLARHHEHQEALLHRALEALRSANPRRHAEALEHLVGMDDPRATQALVEVASTDGPAANEQVRVQAVSALWRHAADLQFRDDVAAQALRQLAEDGNSEVAEVARQAVLSMEQYQHQQAP
jgi:hypothetical protein